MQKLAEIIEIIFKTLDKNEQTLTAAECRICCKSGILAGNFNLHFAHVLEPCFNSEACFFI